MMAGVRRLAKHPALLIFVVGFSIHLWHIGHDLPYNYNTDEPHHINKAANFGSGSLNPRDFKYPTLWSYVLAGMLGGLYAAGLLTGIVTASTDFAQKYLYDSGFFIFCARLLSAFFLCLVPVVFFRLCRRCYSESVAWTVAFLAVFSTGLADFGQQAVPYSLLVFFAVCALVSLHEILRGAGLRSYAKMGLLIGLSISSHYVAAPLASLFLVAFIQETGLKRKVGCFVGGLAMTAAGFFIGTPFLLLNLKAALPDFTEHYKLENVGILANVHRAKLRDLFLNLLHVMDLWGAGLFLILVGLYSELRAKRWIVLLWFLPLASAYPILLLSVFGGVYRYTVLLSVPILIVAAQGLVYLLALCGTSVWKRLVVISALVALFVSSYIVNRLYIAIPDTRTLALEWMQKNVPSGEKVLSPGPYEGPPLLMARNQVERLYERTRELKHPREAYYRTLLSGHPGGGYEIFYVKKSVQDILDLPNRTIRAFQAQEFIDVENEGIAPLLREDVRWVVLMKDWEKNERHQKWISELRSTFSLTASFEPEKNKRKGYFLEIYRYDGRPKER